MSHFLDRLMFFTQDAGVVLRRPRRGHQRGPHLGGRLPQALAARQDRALDARRELHRLVQLEDLRQGRRRDLGDAADRLPAHAPRHAQPRAARLLARRVLLLVPVQRQPAEVSDGARAPGARCGARRARRSDPVEAWASIVEDPQKAKSYKSMRGLRRLRALDLGRGRTRSSPRPTSTRSRSYGPDRVDRLLADSRRCRWCPTPPAAATCR